MTEEQTFIPPSTVSDGIWSQDISLPQLSGTSHIPCLIVRNRAGAIVPVMPSNSKQLTLPSAAVQHICDVSRDHLPADHFVFNPAFVGNPNVSNQSISHVPEQAAPHVPPVVPPPVTLPEA